MITTTNGFYSSSNMTCATNSTTRLIVESFFLTGVTSVIIVVGIPTNLISCLVFWRQGLKDRMKVCLFCLSILDASYLVLNFTNNSVPLFIRLFDQDLGDWYSDITSNYVGVLNGMKGASGVVNMMIALEKLVCVISPFRVSSFMKPKTTAAVICLCFVVLQCCYLVVPLWCSNALSPDVNITATNNYKHNKLLCYVFSTVTLGVILPLGTLLVITITTTITILRLAAAATWRRDASSATRERCHREAALTKMLVIVSCVYVISTTPFVARQASFWLFVEGNVCNETVTEISAVVTTFALTGSLTNFFVYYFSHSNFYFQLHFLLGKCRCGPQIKTTIHSETQIHKCQMQSKQQNSAAT